MIKLGTYKNIAGTTLEVFESGKSFVTRTHYEATRRTPAETVERKHRAFSAVENMIKKYNFEQI